MFHRVVVSQVLSTDLPSVASASEVHEYFPCMAKDTISSNAPRAPHTLKGYVPFLSCELYEAESAASCQVWSRNKFASFVVAHLAQGVRGSNLFPDHVVMQPTQAIRDNDLLLVHVVAH